MRRRGCSIGGCTEPHEARDLCSRHYQRQRKHGDPELVGTRGASPTVFTGQRYGKLVVLREAPRAGRVARYYLTRCDCGTEKAVRGTNLRSGNTKSCGCSRNPHFPR